MPNLRAYATCCLVLPSLLPAHAGELIRHYQYQKAQRRSDSRATLHAKVSEGISIDGVLDEPPWQRARSVSGFMQLVSLRSAAPRTHVSVLRDTNCLYVALRCEAPGLEPVPSGPLAKQSRAAVHSIERVDLYYSLTGSERAAQAIVCWADRLISNDVRYVEPGSGFWTGFAYYDILAAAYRISGDMKYLAHGLGRLILIGNSVCAKRDSALYGATLYGSHSTTGYFPQTAPYMMRELVKLKKLPEPRFPRWDYGPSAGGEFTMYVLDEGQSAEPLVLSLPIRHGSPVTVAIHGPDGKEVDKHTLQPPEKAPPYQYPPPPTEVRLSKGAKPG